MDDIVDRSVSVDGPLLWSDRVDVCPTEEGFLDRMGAAAVSLSTLQRAERGNTIKLSKLIAIADTIGQPYKKYLKVEDVIVARTTIDLTGVWHGFYTEPDLQLHPSIVDTSVTIVQREAQLSMSINEIGSDGEDREELVVEALVVGDMVKISSAINNWRQPAGIASMMLKIRHAEEYMEGFVFWYDKDSNQVEVSRTAYVREGTYSFEKFLEKARKDVAAHGLFKPLAS